MKKTKVIIPALGLLLLSTAASVTGTVAWFVVNDTVTAEGLSITAKTDSEFLVISKTSTLAALTEVDIAESVPADTKVLPTNWVDTNGATADGWSWVYGSGTSTSDGTLNGAYATLTTSETNNVGSAAGKDYYLVDTVYVGLASGSAPTAKNLKCNVTFDANISSNLNKCLTLALDVNDDKGVASDFDERYLLGTDSADAVEKAGQSVLLSGANIKYDGTGTAIKIYAFFNGDNEFCTTQNAINLRDIAIDLEFTLVA